MMSNSDRSVVVRSSSFRHVALLCAVAVALLAGCSATEQKSGAAKTAFRNFRKSIDKMDARVDASVRAMDRLQSPKTADTRRRIRISSRNTSTSRPTRRA